MKKTLNVVAALDSFKGSLTSLEAGNAVKRGILRRIPDADVTVFAVGDGGEGTADALCQSLHADMLDTWPRLQSRSNSSNMYNRRLHNPHMYKM